MAFGESSTPAPGTCVPWRASTAPSEMPLLGDAYVSRVAESFPLSCRRGSSGFSSPLGDALSSQPSLLSSLCAASPGISPKRSFASRAATNGARAGRRGGAHDLLMWRAWRFRGFACSAVLRNDSAAAGCSLPCGCWPLSSPLTRPVLLRQKGAPAAFLRRSDPRPSHVRRCSRKEHRPSRPRS